MKIEAENADVFYIKDERVVLEKNNFNQLYDFALKSSRNRARYCMHQNKDANLHEMFEIFTPQTYLRPIKQIEKVYSYHIISGSVDVYLFSDTGIVTDIISLGDYISGKPFYYRAPKNVYRTLVTLSEYVLYHEVTTGPFKKEDSIFADWAPNEVDKKEIHTFLANLKEIKIKNKLGIL